MTPSWFNWRNAGIKFVDITGIAGGVFHTIFFDSSDDVWNCGHNTYGQLGRAVASGSSTSVNLGQVTALSNIVAAAGGNYESIFIDSSGDVWNCGHNTYGQLGRAVASGSSTSVNLGQVTALSNIVATAVGTGGFSVFLDSSGNVWNCGYNAYGSMGRVVEKGTVSNPNLGQVTGVSNIIAVSVGYYHSIFLNSSGKVWTCGYNSSGQLGRSVAHGSTSSVNLGQVTALSNIVGIAGDGGGNWSMFRNSSGSIWNCGSNSDGQLGRVVGTGTYNGVNLGQVPGLSNIIDFAAGLYHTIFLDSSGNVWTCGNNNYGQLGRAVATGSETVVNLSQVTALSNIVAIAAGRYCSSFLDSSGKVWTCGDNFAGQLGRAVASGSETEVNLGQIPSA
jgi:alpha-tubulin suppressor-like RCC1 family protein